MNYNPINITFEEIKHVLPTLSRRQIIELDQRIHEYLQTSLLSRASETAFSEWEDPEEDLYNADV